MATVRSRSPQPLQVASSSKVSQPPTVVANSSVQNSSQNAAGLPANNVFGQAMTRTLGGAIVWLSGAAAGISAIFYVCGVLVTTANLNMLGLDPLESRYDATFYMHRGGEFLLVSAKSIAEFYFWFFALAGSFLFFLTLIFLALRPWLRKLALKTPLRGLFRHHDLWKFVAYALLLVVLFKHVSTHLHMSKDMSVSDVLYALHGSDFVAKTEPIEQIRNAIVCGRQGSLADTFALFSLQHVFIGISIYLSWLLARAWRGGILLVIPFIIMFVISSFFLPLVYGKFMLPNKFPGALVQLEHSAEIAGGNLRMYLLNKTDNEFVFWDPSGQRIVWLPTRTVASVVFSESQSLHQIARSVAGADQCKL